MLTKLLINPFENSKAMEEFSFHHAEHHRQILQALQKQGYSLIDYTLYPFTKIDENDWLIRHQSMHNAFNGLLGYDGTDLNRVDFKDPQQQTEWVTQNYTEHYSAAVALGLG